MELYLSDYLRFQRIPTSKFPTFSLLFFRYRMSSTQTTCPLSYLPIPAAKEIQILQTSKSLTGP